MRTLMTVHVPVAAGNAAIKDGRMPKLIEQVMADLRPEATYFTADRGVRTMYLVFDLDDPAKIPPTGEPFFTELEAEVSYVPVMNGEDLQRGLAQL
jgi:hypothetical protein